MVDSVNPGASTGNSAQAARPRENISQNYQDFLHLLTTQLQNQDPTSPTDTNQLTQQIATLSQVEQQVNTNKNLETLIGLYSNTQYNSLVGYIDKQIEAEGDVGSLQNDKAAFAYYLASPAETVDIKIKNEDGTVVFTGTGTKLAGRNEIVWNGKNNNGEAQPPGTYHISVVAKDGGDNVINSRTYTTGRVTSVDSANGKVFLSIGDVSIPIENVLSVRTPTVTI